MKSILFFPTFLTIKILQLDDTEYNFLVCIDFLSCLSWFYLQLFISIIHLNLMVFTVLIGTSRHSINFQLALEFGHSWISTWLYINQFWRTLYTCSYLYTNIIIIMCKGTITFSSPSFKAFIVYLRSKPLFEGRRTHCIPSSYFIRLGFMILIRQNFGGKLIYFWGNFPEIHPC